MEKEHFQTYLRQNIPLTAAMDFQVTAFDSQRISISAPLAPNVNHQNTAFGGSINSLLILAAWSWVHRSLMDHQEEGVIVIQNSQVNFISPIATSLEATVLSPESKDVEKFYHMFRKFGKGRIRLASQIVENGKPAAQFEGSFVVFRKK